MKIIEPKDIILILSAEEMSLIFQSLSEAILKIMEDGEDIDDQADKVAKLLNLQSTFGYKLSDLGLYP